MSTLIGIGAEFQCGTYQRAIEAPVSQEARLASLVGLRCRKDAQSAHPCPQCVVAFEPVLSIRRHHFA